MNPRWSLRTARLVLTPVGGADLPDLIAIKADPRVFAVMLGGVRSPAQTQEELARDVVSENNNPQDPHTKSGSGPTQPGSTGVTVGEAHRH